uniref:Reverse transcriptase zinc-binding domain-containing protein n=1 Tax=Cannabis sativa TaxID=3483 RepID=A0A803PCX7_CANSA
MCNKYVITQGYLKLIAPENKEHWPSIVWSRLNFPKHSFVMWMAMLNRLKTKVCINQVKSWLNWTMSKRTLRGVIKWLGKAKLSKIRRGVLAAALAALVVLGPSPRLASQHPGSHSVLRLTCDVNLDARDMTDQVLARAWLAKPHPAGHDHDNNRHGQLGISGSITAPFDHPMAGQPPGTVPMGRTKWSYHKAPPSDPHVAKVATMGMVGVVEEATQPLDDIDLKATIELLGQTSVISLDHVLAQSLERQVVDAVLQRDWWVSPPSVITTEAFNRIIESGLVRGIQCEVPSRDQLVHWLAFRLDGKIAKGLEKREMALFQYFARGATIGDATLWIRPRGQSYAWPTRPFPTSIGKGKDMISSFDLMLNARNQENTLPTAENSRLVTELKRSDEKRKATLDGQ